MTLKVLSRWLGYTFCRFKMTYSAVGVEVRVPTRHVLTHLGLRLRDVIRRMEPENQLLNPSQAF